MCCKALGHPRLFLQDPEEMYNIDCCKDPYKDTLSGNRTRVSTLEV